MIRGTSHEQDSRFTDKAKKMLQESQWPEKYDIKIDLSKIDFDTLRNWIEKRINQLLGYEDDIVSGTVVSLLEDYLQKSEKPNAKKMHVSLSGFLTTHTLTFMSELWDHLDQAQKTKSGIANKIIEERQRDYERNHKKMREIEKKNEKVRDYKFKEVVDRYGKRGRTPSVERRRKNRKEKEKERSRSGSRSLEKKRNRHRSRSREKWNKQKLRRKSESIPKSNEHKIKSSRRKEYSKSRTPSEQHRKKRKTKKRYQQSSSSSSSSNERSSSSSSSEVISSSDSHSLKRVRSRS